MAATTMQLEFAQAMTDFKTMFPDMDKEVIEAVLRANQGAVDATIDQLLAMSTDNQNEKLRNELDLPIGQCAEPIAKSSKTQPIAATIDDIDGGQISLLSSSPLPPSTLIALNTGASPKIKKPLVGNNGSQTNSPRRGPSPSVTTVSSNVEHLPLRLNRRWNPPMLGPLPAGFLRLPLESRDFEIPDEQFAVMLQNEEFMNELRWNPEFMLSLEKEQYLKSRGEDDAAFAERLKHMGKRSRKKFMQLARVFTWQRKKKPPVRHPDSLLLQEEHSEDDEPRRAMKGK